MRVPFLSDCEADFIKKSFAADLRLDGRKRKEWRRLELGVAREGSGVVVRLGRTAVRAEVGLDLVEPEGGGARGGHEGTVRLNLELSPMGAPDFEPGRLGEEGVALSRLLERVVKEAGMIDVESLCVQAGQRVWELRIEVEVLDADGALADTASVAVLAALLLATRPDVSLQGDNITLHPPSDRDPVPISLYHHPVAITIGFIEDGSVCVVDPTWREERVLQGSLIFVFNTRKEICAVHSTGSVLMTQDLVMKCAGTALERALSVIEEVRSAVAEEKQKRKAGTSQGLRAWTWGTRAALAAREETVTAVSLPATDSAKQPAMPDPQVMSVRAGGSVRLGGKTWSDGLMLEREESTAEDDAALVQAIQSSSTGPAKEEPEDMDASPSTKRKKKSKRPPPDDDLLNDIEADIQILDPPKKEVITIEEEDEGTIDLTAALKPKAQRKKKKGKGP